MGWRMKTVQSVGEPKEWSQTIQSDDRGQVDCEKIEYKSIRK
ncbi:MAG TPA: hypothetical protein P5168_04065 [Candidatus Methanomethylicus sp.]|nr:hypothetical protein [Candidatus Methanomethylicus sp.]HRU81707.1 hypothetical protein [Candidatus Methanomethylicus sp.]